MVSGPNLVSAMIKTTAVVVDNKAISGDNDVDIVKSNNSSSSNNRGGVGGGGGGAALALGVANSDYYYKNFYVRNPNEIKIFENNASNDANRDSSSSAKLTSNSNSNILQQRSSFSEQDSKEGFTIVNNKLYNTGNKSPSAGNEPIRFRTVTTVPTFVQIDEHRPVSFSETRVVSADLSSAIGKLSTSSTSSPSSNFSQLSLSSSSLSSLSSSSSTDLSLSTSSASYLDDNINSCRINTLTIDDTSK